ncbi:nucleotidyl transferase AbiEii/AbiGii toxin family protein [Bradyrhizobium pachyrhizi]|uniref:nucleotidyl transferase AbiEii/AbiGii toxin family protein n=1 Tax=Bradyrhizobium pachyrhizi TaxID=280333 RepID=UPI001364DBCF
MTSWRQLLSRTIIGLEQLEQQGQAVPDWILAGGTALMLHSEHRLSRDIDAVIDDPQYWASCRRTSPTFGIALPGTRRRTTDARICRGRDRFHRD